MTPSEKSSFMNFLLGSENLLILQMLFPIEISLATRDTNPGSGGFTPQKCLAFRIQKSGDRQKDPLILCVV